MSAQLNGALEQAHAVRRKAALSLERAIAIRARSRAASDLAAARAERAAAVVARFKIDQDEPTAIPNSRRPSRVRTWQSRAGNREAEAASWVCRPATPAPDFAAGRERPERELHDDIAQTLFGLRLTLEASLPLARRDMRIRLEETVSELDSVVAHLRNRAELHRVGQLDLMSCSCSTGYSTPTRGEDFSLATGGDFDMAMNSHHEGSVRSSEGNEGCHRWGRLGQV